MKKGLRRVAAVAVATLVVAPALATVASATSTFAFDRLAGIDRYATSVAVAGQYGASTNVILASGVPGHYPDALTASYLAGFKSAPIMLTLKDATPANVVARITASGATDVWLVGGTGVISAAQEAALDVKFGTVHRLGGLDRYLTAAAVIGAAGVATSTTHTAVLATGVNFPDAIAGGPLSYVKGMPLAITLADRLPAATLSSLKAAGVTNVIALGGPTIITPAVLAALAAQGITLNQRIYGANRSETSSLLATEMITNQGFLKTGVNVASGYAFGTGADALGGAPLSGKETRPTLITESVTTVGPGVLGYLTANCATLASGHVFGGLGAVSATSEAAMQAAGRCAVGSNQTLTVSGTTQGNDLGVDGARQCTATVPAGSVVDAALFPSEDVRIASTGVVTFTDAVAPTSQADNEGATAVSISSVNGAPTSGSEQNNISAVGTSVSFTIYSAATPDDVTLVVWSDQAGFTANTLDLVVPTIANNDPKAPREAFGVGCRTLFANEAAGGSFGPAAVESTDKPTNLFTAGAANFFYDANDVFQIGGVPQPAGQPGLDAFEARLSPGDSVSGTYAPSAAGVSTFNLTDSSPAVPASSSAVVSGTTITLSYAESTTATADAYNIYRIVRPTAGTCPDFNVGGSLGRGAYPATPTATQVDPTPSTAGVTTRTFTDSGLAPNTFYCYVVTTVDEGDESAAGTAFVEAETSTVGTVPTLLDVRADDAGTIGLVDSGDLHQFIFSEPMNTTIDNAGSLYRIQDADGTVAEVKCGVAPASICTLQAAGTFNGTAYAAAQVMRVTLGTVTPLAGFLGTVAGIQYPATITNVTAGWDDVAGNQLDLAGSTDKVINVATITP